MAAPYHHRRFTSRATAAVAVALTALAMLSAGPSSASPSATATTTTAPTIASSATSTDGYVRWLQVRPNTTSVTLWWTSYHSTTFMVRRDDGVGDPTPTSGSLVYSGTEFRTVDTAVTPWTTYRYTLWGDDGAGGYLPPQSIRATTGVQGVTGLTSRATSAGTAAVSWDAPSDPGVALVTLTRTDQQGAVRTVYSGTAAKTVDTGLMPGAAYSYTVVAQDASGRRGPVSSPESLTTHRTWTTTAASPYVGWPAALACPTTTWCMAVNNTGTFQVMSGSSWSAPVKAFTPMPTPDRFAPIVSSLTCPAPGRCLAVRGSILIEFVNGGWRSAGAPSSSLWGAVDCPTTTYCVAIRRDGWSITRTGTTWTTPVRIGTLSGVTWYEVACQAAAHCFAIAVGNATNSNWRGALTSAGWSTGYLGSWEYGNAYRISCSTSTCLALGDRVRVTVSGTSWSIQSLPQSDNADDYTNELSCGTPSLCMALNYGNVARWSSTAVLERTKLSAGIGTMAAVSCPRTGGACFAVDDRGRFYRWTATSHWTMVTTSAPTSGGVNRVGCPSTTSCFFFDANGYLVTWNGASWTRSGKLFTQPATTECSGSEFCIAVDGVNRVYRVWSKGVWGAAKAMPLSATDLSCGSPTLCLAVDDQGRASRFNGTGWWAPVAALPNTYGGGARVSCAPAGPCMLVSSDGSYRRYVGTAFTTTQRMPQGFSAQDVVLSCGAPSACIVVLDQGAWAQWNGSVWTAHPAEMTAYRLGSLTCLTATHCLATHPYSNDTVPEVWNSGVWSDDGTYTPDEIPFAPECPTPDTCFVAGGTTVSRSS